jgi:N-acetylglutamate synthase-like GNAT family acetyltransferase
MTETCAACDTVVVAPGVERDALLPLFRLADDSERQIRAYCQRGTLYVARRAGEAAGLLLTIRSGDTAEVMSVAVAERFRRQRVGTRLVVAALDDLRRAAVRRVTVATATCSHDVMAFYQKRGFRMSWVEPDFFTEARGYSAGLAENGIPVRDRLWLTLDLGPAARGPRGGSKYSRE